MIHLCFTGNVYLENTCVSSLPLKYVQTMGKGWLWTHFKKRLQSVMPSKMNKQFILPFMSCISLIKLLVSTLTESYNWVIHRLISWTKCFYTFPFWPLVKLVTLGVGCETSRKYPLFCLNCPRDFQCYKTRALTTGASFKICSSPLIFRWSLSGSGSEFYRKTGLFLFVLSRKANS